MVTCQHEIPGRHQKESVENHHENAAGYSAQDEYHCHLAHKWVACWRIREGEIEIEVYYAGSRENAPY
jgi:hypothetical protein